MVIGQQIPTEDIAKEIKTAHFIFKLYFATLFCRRYQYTVAGLDFLLVVKSTYGYILRGFLAVCMFSSLFIISMNIISCLI